MDITNDTIWEWFLKIFEWLGSALLAVAIFIFKGYRDEFAFLKKDNEEMKQTMNQVENNNSLLIQKLTHIDNNLKNWNNGSEQMFKDIMTLEKNYELLKMEIHHLKDRK